MILLSSRIILRITHFTKTFFTPVPISKIRVCADKRGAEKNVVIASKSDLVVQDLDLIKTFPSPLVSWSINTLNETFKNDMDKAVSIERRIAAMKRCHEEGIRTTCFISPIFPEITNIFDIIEKIKSFCDYIWLENLNLRSNFKPVIMDYIAKKYPDLLPLYQQIYNRNDLTYWEILDRKATNYAEKKFFYLFVIIATILPYGNLIQLCQLILTILLKSERHYFGAPKVQHTI